MASIRISSIAAPTMAQCELSRTQICKFRRDLYEGLGKCLKVKCENISEGNVRVVSDGLTPLALIASGWMFSHSTATKISLSAVMVVIWERKSAAYTYSRIMSVSWLVSFLKEQ